MGWSSNNNDDHEQQTLMSTEEKKVLMNELGISDDHDYLSTSTMASATTTNHNKLHPLLATGMGIALVLNVTIILSLPPVLRGRGAPYLPTFKNSLNSMFTQLRKDPDFKQKLQRQGGNNKLTFVDLGSGDGRIVFRAAREGIFYKSMGYEINPFLHLFARTSRLCRPRYWSSTSFYLGDLWKVDLSKADVVAIYGLAPIMNDLGIKLQNELRPGSIVLSNVFSIPGWRPSSSSHGAHIYKTPQCWEATTKPQ